MINKQHWAKHALTRKPLIHEILQSAHVTQCGFDVSVALSSKRYLLDSRLKVGAVFWRMLKNCRSNAAASASFGQTPSLLNPVPKPSVIRIDKNALNLVECALTRMPLICDI
jgi:hypothetical protein